MVRGHNARTNGDERQMKGMGSAVVSVSRSLNAGCSNSPISRRAKGGGCRRYTKDSETVYQVSVSCNLSSVQFARQVSYRFYPK